MRSVFCRLGALGFLMATALAYMPAPVASASEGTAPGWRIAPAAGPVGTLVHFSGPLPKGRSVKGLFVDLTGTIRLPSGRLCGLSLDLKDEHHALDNRGRLHGSFVIGPTGGCVQSELNEQATIPGRYGLSVGAPSSVVGFFEVTPPATALPMTGVDASTILVDGLAAALIGALLLGAGTRSRRDGHRTYRMR